MTQRIVVTCDYCGAELEADQLGHPELRFSHGIRNVVVGKCQQSGETEQKWLARITRLSDACPTCIQKAAAALGLRLERDADGRYYFSRRKESK